MSLRMRATVGAILLFGGLLLAFGAGMTKSNHRLQYERDLERHRPDPRVPENGVANVLLVMGLLIAGAGPVLLVSAMRDMTRQIGDAQSRAESLMRTEVAVKRDANPKPKP
jgi:hypothetical protein